MASEVDIANLALILLGQEAIGDLSEDTASARAISAQFDIVRDDELASRWWRFAVKRDSLPSLVPDPEGNDFALQYQLPNDFLSMIRLGDGWQGYDATDYRTGPTNEYSIEADKLLTNYAAPLFIQYSAKITDTSLFHPCFNSSFAARLAYICCEKLTGSTSRQDFCQSHYKSALMRALSVSALLNGPSYKPDNSWVIARLG